MPKVTKNQRKPSSQTLGLFALVRSRVAIYIELTRLNKPIGLFLLLWPSLWALWVAADGVPPLKLLGVFLGGVILMRSAGCVINDYADRNFDGQVARTERRPLAQKLIKPNEALLLAAILALLAFFLVLETNLLTIKLAVVALGLAIIYPYMKRHTHMPQMVLGAAFAWSAPMAYAAVGNAVSQSTWLIYTAAVLWTVAYDTMYAMVDRDDDIKIGVKSTAILFGDMDKVMIGILQVMALFALYLLGQNEDLGLYFHLGLTAAMATFIYQQWLIKSRDQVKCFDAFLNNAWTGMVIFLGLMAEYWFAPIV